LLSGYIASSVRAVRNYLYEYGTTNNYALMGTDSYFRSNVCFQQYTEIRRPAARNSEPTVRCPVINRRQHQSHALRQIAHYLDYAEGLADQLVCSFPNAVEDLFEIVATSETAVPDVNLISLENWNRVTLSDHALSLLMQISENVSREKSRFLEAAIRVLKCYAGASTSMLSKPLAFAMMQILASEQNQICFAELNGHLLIARELERSIVTSSYDWATPISAPLMRKLASLSAQVAGSGDPQSSRMPSEMKIDGMFNYAPLCNGEWFDMTLILPYHIVLHEIQIRPHIPALNTAPAAVQVELCSETSLSQWCNLGAPLSTTGFCKIRISTVSYKLPVIAVRLYLKKPPDSTTLSLSQILLLGMNSTSAFANVCPKNTDFVQWLSIMVELCNLKNYCIWEYAPELPGAVVALFLGRPLSGLVYSRISQLLCQIDSEEAKPNSVVELIFLYIDRGNSVTNESLEWLPDLLFRLCAEKLSPWTSDPEKQHKNCVIKQCQMLLGLTTVIAPQNKNKSLRDVLAVLLWTTSCILWHNMNVIERRSDTLAMCTDLAPPLLPSVRLYLKKPPDSTTLSLSQILLLGMNSTSAFANVCPKNTDFVQWLSIMVELCNLKNYCIWEYAPELPGAVVALFLGRPLSGLVYSRISQLLCQIDSEEAKPNSVVELIFLYIDRGNSVTNESLEWLPDLLFRLCAEKLSPWTSDPEKQHKNCVIKQCQMLLGLTTVIAPQNKNKSLRVRYFFRIFVCLVSSFCRHIFL
uniref:Mab-21 domain-containing protein n=1 Tax=Gongylonema pulchrum TaxID=637853 RepID=A0A183DSH7_9BILA